MRWSLVAVLASALSVIASANAPPANATPLTVTGTSGALKRTTTVTLTIQ